MFVCVYLCICIYINFIIGLNPLSTNDTSSVTTTIAPSGSTNGSFLPEQGEETGPTEGTNSKYISR